jgi:hypothetical protein
MDGIIARFGGQIVSVELADLGATKLNGKNTGD